MLVERCLVAVEVDEEHLLVERYLVAVEVDEEG